MGDQDKGLKRVLWENVRTLMVMQWGEEHIQRLVREAKIGPATATRIKEGRTSVGIDIVERIARVFKVEPWQLLAAGLGDEKFLDILRVWRDTDARGKRMLLSAAKGASEDGAAEQERTVGRTVRR
jgi:hypothetical protein